MSELAVRDRPIFVCGHPKSGTSLLRNLLDHHPQLVVYPEESLFFRKFLPQAAGLTDEEIFDLAKREIIHIFEWNQEDQPTHQAGFPDRDYSEISFEQVAAVLGEGIELGDVRHPGDLLALAVLAFGKVAGYDLEETRAWVEKSPGNEFFADLIFGWWPQARCIHIVRDPRDNYASYQRKQKTWSPGKFASHWNRSTIAGYANAARFGDDRYRILRYEDLVTDPEASLADLCQFLEIESHPSLLQPTRVGKPWRGNSMFGNQFEAISAAAVGRWSEGLTSGQAGIIQSATRGTRRRLNYRDEIQVAVRDLFTGWYWWLKGQFYDLRQGLKRKM